MEEPVELTNITNDVPKTMINLRPFRNMYAARKVSNKIVDTRIGMFQGYEVIDALVTRYEHLGKSLVGEMDM